MQTKLTNPIARVSGASSAPPLMRMQWRHLLFMHWRVPLKQLRPLVPMHLEIDEFDGSAWVGLVPFTMRDVMPRFAPQWRGLCDVPRFSAFHECNVRTYVYPRGRPDLRGRGVWFFSLDAHSRAGVWTARTFFHLPYFYSRIDLHCDGDAVRYSVNRLDSPRARMRCEWRIGSQLPPSESGDIAHFLTERYRLYSVNRAGQLFCGRIEHVQWPLHEATLVSLDDELVKGAGITIDQSQTPLLHYAKQLDVRAWRLEAVNAQ
jgi:uncharacterized protein